MLVGYIRVSSETDRQNWDRPGAAAPLASPVELLLGGVEVPAANVLYAGISPCCAGLYQLDFTIPAGTPPGNIPLVMVVDGVSSPANANIIVH